MHLSNIKIFKRRKMKKFTLILVLLLSLLTSGVLIAQCNRAVNVSDSLELIKMIGNRQGPVNEWSRIGLKDTLGECRVDSVRLISTNQFVQDGELYLPFLRTLYLPGYELPSFNLIDAENLPSLERLTFESGFNHSSVPNIPDINIPSLKELYIDGRNINGEIPDFSKMPELRILKISHSGTSGQIPDFSNMNKLESLLITGTALEGPIPDFSNLPNLKFLNLSGGSLNGTIPDFDQLPLLEVLNLSYSQLTGTIPDFIDIPLLNELVLYRNQLTGVIPNFSNLPLLKKLNICSSPFQNGVGNQSNDFIEPIPGLENCPLLNTNNVDFTCVRSAPINPACTVSENDSLELVNFYQATNGNNWQVNTGWLQENASSWWGIEVKDTLGQCRVSKMLVRGIDEAVQLPQLNLPFLEELILDYNNFTSNIPDISNLANLRVLNLGVNNFTGALPDLSNLSQLEEINLSQNELVDEITGYPNQPNLKILDVSGNQLTGEIPNFDDNTELQQLNVSDNLLTGTITDFQNIPNLNYLNVSGNQLTGTIPDFSNLPNLRTLNVADNQLTDELPNFSNIPILESLFVQGNQLSGRVPNFNNLPLLEELIVCDNNFEGTPPNFSLSTLLNVDAIDFSCLQSAKVNGYVYYDANENCMYDGGDITIPNGLISINNGTNYQPVDENGYYEIALEVGTNLITFIQTSPLWQTDCEDILSVTSLTINDISEIDFANQPTIECTQLTVDIGTHFLRRCFKNTYTVQYCNQGTQPAVDAYIEIDFEPEIIPLSASIPYDENNNLLTFQLGEVGIGECGSFTVIDSVACDAPLSSTGCVEAHIYPDAFCFSPTNWDGANLAINAFCVNNDSVQFIIENLGEDMSVPSFFRMYEEAIMVVEGEFTLSSGATKTLAYEGNGSTYRVAVEQTPGHPSLDDAQAFYDVYEGDELTYKIRFQNTGNDTAFTVVLVDTLDTEHLDISTLEVLNSSHNYTLSIEDAQILTFTFNDILTKTLIIKLVI